MPIVEIAASAAIPQAICVTINADTEELVQQAIDSWAARYAKSVFLPTLRCADKTYAAFGRVWPSPDQLDGR